VFHSNTSEPTIEEPWERRGGNDTEAERVILLGPEEGGIEKKEVFTYLNKDYMNTADKRADLFYTTYRKKNYW